MISAHGIEDPTKKTLLPYPPPADQTVNDDDDDVWASSGDENSLPDKSTHHERLPPSDTVRIRRDHFNAGYLEGVTATKEIALQSGFDEGYPVGAQIGQQAGEIIGFLQGQGLRDLEKSATLELSAERLFSKEYWNSSTQKIWEGDIHPLILKWQTLISNLS